MQRFYCGNAVSGTNAASLVTAHPTHPSDNITAGCQKTRRFTSGSQFIVTIAAINCDRTIVEWKFTRKQTCQ